MKGASLSLASRLALGAALLVAVALVVAATGVGFTLYHFIRGQVDQRLDAQIATIEQALEWKNGSVSLSRDVDKPPFDGPLSGWYWEVRDQKPLFASSSLAGRSIDLTDSGGSWQDYLFMRDRPAQGLGPDRQRLVVRVASFVVGPKAVTIVVSAPVGAVMRPMVDALVPLAITLLLLGVCLAAAMIVQVRVGLRPLRRLRVDLAAIRAGRAEKLPDDQPRDLAPLTGEVNNLLKQNAAGLERARRSAANLAHALKTPLATLAATLQMGDHETDAKMLAEVERMERQIRHHLRRARTAALTMPVRSRARVRDRAEDIAAVLIKIHSHKPIVFTDALDPAFEIACEPHDLDEIVGNVLDNAFKFARSRVELSQSTEVPMVFLHVDDDGPGLANDAIPTVLLPGRRLDETIPGDGFGLAIAGELVALYNGSLMFGRSPLGGLRVSIGLPH